MGHERPNLTSSIVYDRKLRIDLSRLVEVDKPDTCVPVAAGIDNCAPARGSCRELTVCTWELLGELCSMWVL